MTAEEELNKYPSVKIGLDDFYGRQTTIRAMESYHKEASKELLEACKISLHLCDMLRMPTQTDLESLAVDLRKALENHLKTTNPH